MVFPGYQSCKFTHCSSMASSYTVSSIESELLNMDLRSVGGKSLPDFSLLRKSSHIQGPKVLQIQYLEEVVLDFAELVSVLLAPPWLLKRRVGGVELGIEDLHCNPMENPSSLENLLQTLNTRGWCFRDINLVNSLIAAQLASSYTVSSIESELLNMDLRSVGGKSLPDFSLLRKSSHIQGPNKMCR